MWNYEPPLRDIRFIIEELLAAPAQWARIPRFSHVDAELARQVCEAAGQFAGDVLVPLNASGDLEGCTWSGEQVGTPRGFREAYRSFVEAGWPSLACDPEVGGQGLPHLINAVLFEMLCSANHAWTMYPGLLHGAYECLHGHASPELKQRYLAKVVSGEWLATMCLTEAQAGSDLGLIKTRAVLKEDGAYALTGTKIFISGGEHDLTDNIVHLVLARMPDAPQGTKGLSLFLAPKFLPDGTRNVIRCDGVEKKMGIKGSATCVMTFDGATGWLVGQANRGLAAMFAMMNPARLHVGLQGLGHAEAAYQNALRYAAERPQLRAIKRPPEMQERAADPIALHPAMRRTLWSLRARVEGARLLAYETAQLLDLSLHSGCDKEQARASDLLSFLTPVVKSYLTDQGFAIASEALQVFGGYGYIHDYGIEQSVRDVRIAMIYEGTNEIQANDLLVRKILPDGGARFDALLNWLDEGLPEDGAFSPAVRSRLDELRQVTQTLVEVSKTDPELGQRVATDFLKLLALVLLAQGWARAAAAAEQALAAGSEEAGFYSAKRETAQHYMNFVLPEADLRLKLLAAGQCELPFLPVSL